MGAGPSQDTASLPIEESNDAQMQSKNTDHVKAIQTTTEVSLPHNCDNILKDADSPTDKSSTNKLYDQLCAGVFLNQKRKKYWVEKESKSNCFMLFAQDLFITWSDDIRFWQWPLFKESSDEWFAVAELQNVCWLEVHGKFDTANLSPGILYEVVFVVMLKDTAYGWEVPVNFRLTLPDGSTQQHKEKLMEKPKGQWIEIPAGELKTSAHQNVGEMEASLYEYDGGKWKKGLLVKGVVIRPKLRVPQHSNILNQHAATV
ncbi:Protein PHLOEM PROTEIN 2-LIKE A1 [Forsythia ovata]|uniref:Protein PHLOEM PROTEIN 2-LIKE A1 n=1 Tax=Forsythia ovata TaxID=205694 RepID=A0ABD1S0V3_9LAMI